MSLIVNGRSAKDYAETSIRVNEYGQISITKGATPGLPYQFFLTASGDGVGNHNLNGNYAAAATDFYYQATSRYEISEILISIADSANFNQLDYGAIPNGTVNNGIKLFIQPAATSPVIPLLSGVAIAHNFDWLSLTSNVFLTTFAGTAQTLSVVFRMLEQYDMPLVLDTGGKIIARLNDDFTGLVSHTFGIRGIKY